MYSHNGARARARTMAPHGKSPCLPIPREDVSIAARAVMRGIVRSLCKI